MNNSIKHSIIENLSFEEEKLFKGVMYVENVEIIHTRVNKSFMNLCTNFQKVVIEDCVFSKFTDIDNEVKECLNIYRGNFEDNLFINKSSFFGRVNMSALHCLGKVIIENNIFEEFVDFGDCWFKGTVIIRNNQFKKGTNLLGNQDKPYKVTFDKKPCIENNTGNLAMDVLPE